MVRVYFLIFSFCVSTSLLTAQCIKGNCLNGTGVYQFKSGSKYLGQFKNGKIFKQGSFYFRDGRKYIGQWQNQRMAGLGVLKYPNGRQYEGSFASNQFHGDGIIKMTNGEFFKGKWDNGKQVGPGYYHFKDGTVEKGEWIKGRFISSVKIEKEEITESANTLLNCNRINCTNGEGRYTYQDGSYYEGQFRNGNPEGEGICHYKNGDKFVGGWKNNAPHGEGIMYFNSGLVYAAIWSNGYPIKKINNKPEESSQPVYTSNRPKYDEEVKIWAVIVGIAGYNHMPTLKYTDDDAYQMYAFLKSPEGGAIPNERISLLIDEAASRDNIISSMKSTFSKADENDVIMLYYSGHGLPGSFLPIDFDGYNNVIQHHEIKQILEESEAKHKICFADACHSGSLLAMKSPFNATRMNSFFEEFENTDSGTALFTSSKSEEISMETTGLRQGIYSHYLIRGLGGEADYDGNKIVTISELYDYVSRNVKSYTSNRQTPVIAGSYDKDMPVAIVR